MTSENKRDCGTNTKSRWIDNHICDALVVATILSPPTPVRFVVDKARESNKVVCDLLL